MLTPALRGGVQVETHAIGNRGNRIMLDLRAAALKMFSLAPAYAAFVVLILSGGEVVYATTATSHWWL